MKQNLIQKLLFSLLPLNMLVQNTGDFTQLSKSEVYMCEAVASKAPVIKLEKKTKNVFEEKPVENRVKQEKIIEFIAPETLESLFEQYASEYGISSTTLKMIAQCESRFNPSALSKNGLYGGLFQYSAATWASTRRAMGLDENPELRFNAQEAIKTSAFKIANGGIGAWPTCGRKAQSI